MASISHLTSIVKKFEANFKIFLLKKLKCETLFREIDFSSQHLTQVASAVLVTPNEVDMSTITIHGHGGDILGVPLKRP